MTPMYPPVRRSNTRLNAAKNLPSGPPACCFGLSSMADRAGLRVSALKAEKSTEMAMVMANCW